MLMWAVSSISEAANTLPGPLGVVLPSWRKTWLSVTLTSNPSPTWRIVYYLLSMLSRKATQSFRLHRVPRPATFSKVGVVLLNVIVNSIGGALDIKGEGTVEDVDNPGEVIRLIAGDVIISEAGTKRRFSTNTRLKGKLPCRILPIVY